MANGSDILMIGDSITDGSRSALTSAIPGITIVAQHSKQFGGTNDKNPSGIQLLQTESLKPIIVFALGTNNNGLSDSEVTRVISLVGQSRRLVFVTNYKLNNSSYFSSNNNKLKQAASTNTNVYIADWDRVMSSQSNPNSLITSDGYLVHPSNPNGTKLFADTVAGVLSQIGVSGSTSSVSTTITSQFGNATVRTMTREEVISLGWSGEATLIDLKTQIAYKILGSAPVNYNHSDYHVASENDCYAKRQSFGLVPNKTRSLNTSDWTWSARPVLLQIKGKENILICTSTHCFAHAAPLGPGGFCPDRTQSNTAPSGGWNVGAHFCLHYIDTILLRDAKIGDGSFSDKMYQAVIEASRLANSTDLNRIQFITGSDFTGSDSGGFGVGTLGIPVQRADPPVVIREGEFTLKFETAASMQFMNKLHIPCYADKVPFMYLPSNYSIGDKKAEDFIGYCGLLVNNKDSNAQAMVVGGIGRVGQIDTVSVRAGWGIGAKPTRPNKIETLDMSGDFTLAIFNDFAPDWTGEVDLISQIENECSRRLSAGLGHLNQNARAMALSGGTMNPSAIDPSLIEKYILTLDRSTRNFDLSQLADLGVIGVMIEAGSAFTMTHMRQSEFQNPKLNDQIKACQDAKLDFALYMDARARTKVEVQYEMKYLTNIVRKYPPMLGMWLKPQFLPLPSSKLKDTNNDVVDEYYKQLVKIGLIDKVGFYCPLSQLELIDWDKYSKDWYWWMVESVSDVAELDALLTPEFFMYDRPTQTTLPSLLQGAINYVYNTVQRAI